MTTARLALAMTALSQAQLPKPTVVTVAEVAAVMIAPGGKAEACVSATVAPRFHVQANPASQPYLIPLRLDLQEKPPLRLASPVYPAGKPHRLQGSDLDFSVYDGTIEVCVPVEATHGAATGDLAIVGSLRYQACDDRRCLRPQTVSVRVPVRVTKREP